MKIELDLMDNGISHKQQIEAVSNYIENNVEKVIESNVLDIIPHYTTYIKTTSNRLGFLSGQKIEMENRNFHVSCRKTKSGIYKFKVWQAV